ncbi:MAG: DUF6178 family protein [Pseudomonadota bacterium]
MQHDQILVPVSQDGERILELMRIDRKQAEALMPALPLEEQVSLVSREAAEDPKAAQDLLFLLEDEKSSVVVDGLSDRTVFRIMKAQSSTHIGILSLVNPHRLQSVLDLDQELFSTQGVTDPQTAYHWMVSFLEEDEATFDKVLRSIDIRVVASAFQAKVLPVVPVSDDRREEDGEQPFAADFLVKLDRGELKPDDLNVKDEETLDILTKIHLVDEGYFNELVHLMVREDDLATRCAEAAFDRIRDQVGDISQFTEEAEDMFVPLEE